MGTRPRRGGGHRRSADARTHVPDGPAQSFHAGRYADRLGHDRRHGGDRRRRRGRRLRIAAKGHRTTAGGFAGHRGVAAGRRTAQPGALVADGGAGDRARHRYHEARDPRLRPSGHDGRVPGRQGHGVALPILGARRNRRRFDPLGHHRRHLRAKGLDPAVRGAVRQHVDLRRDALLRVERRHVLHDGRCRGRNAAGDLRAARRDDAEQASRLEPGAGRRARCRRRLFRGERLLCTAPTLFRLAGHVAPQPSDRAVAGPAGRPHPRIGQVPAAARAGPGRCASRPSRGASCGG